MKYMILTFGSQNDYDVMSGKPSAEPAWTNEDFIAVVEFMTSFNQQLMN
jgi:hypothetical protein